MDVIVYVETNFLVSVAMGREASGDNLLAAASDSLRVAIPDGCFMESFSAFEDEQKRRNRFRGELDNQITQLRRDSTSANAGTLLRNLEESRIANDQLVNDIQGRLFQVVGRAAGIFIPIATTPDILHAAIGHTLIPDPTDNLIVHAIISDASWFPALRKVLLTGNSKDFGTEEVEAALAAVGIERQFRTVTDVLRWCRASGR